MSSESPAAILFSSDGYELSAITATAIPTGTRGLLAMGSDGSNSRFISVDTSARVITAGAGTAGSPLGGVLSIQGVAGGTPMPVSGSLTITGGSGTASDGYGNPTAASQELSFLMGYNGASWDRLRSSIANGLVVDVSRVQGTVDVSDRAARLVGVVYGSQAQQLKQTATNFNLATELFAGATAYDARQIRALTSADVVTSNQGTAAVTANAWPIKVTDGTNVASLLNTTPAGTEYGLVVRNIPSGTQTISGTVTANAGTGNFTVTQATAANLNAAVVGTGIAGTPSGGVLTVQGAATGTALPVAPAKSATSTLTNVAGSASSVTILAANANRNGAAIYNDSSSALFIKYGTTASNTSFTVRLLAQSYHEVPFNYTGRIDGIWNSSTGNARVTEITT